LHNGFLEVIEIRARPDRALLWFTIVLGCGAGLSLLLADVAPAWKAAGLMAGAGTAFRGICRRLPRRGSHYVARVLLLPDGRWTIICGDSHPRNARLQCAWGARLGPVIGLEWRCDDGRRRQVWLLERDLPRPILRRLRVRLSLS
jgi:hypothetical protein